MRWAFWFACRNRLAFCARARLLVNGPGPCEECGHVVVLAVIWGEP